MLNFNWKYAFIFVLLLLMQVLLFNHVYISGYINPQVYLFYVLMLPVHTRGYVLLLSAFLLGLAVDAFTDSMAIHSMATVFMAFCRPAVLRMLTGKVSLEGLDSPSFYSLGTISLVLYAFLLILLHHTTLFFLEIFRFDEFMVTLSRALVSSAVTLIFVLLAFALMESSAIKKRH